MRRICKICGVAEDEHHKAEWREQPDGCVCDPIEWDVDVIPPPCAEYHGDGTHNCTRCEHDKECHTANAILEARAETTNNGGLGDG